MDGDCIVETPTRTHKGYQLMKNTLKILALASFFSFLYSCFSGFPYFSYNLQFSTLIFPLLAHALDRKYMFLICNGILAFLANNLRISSSTSNYSVFIKTAEDGVKQIPELPPMLKEEIVQENVVSVEYDAEEQTGWEQEQDYEDLHGGAEEINTEGILLESENLKEEEDEELNENRVVEVNESSVSTEELNHKFEEFIRKMKEEIRIEAQQPLMTV